MIFNLGVKRISKVPASVLKAGKERKVVEEVPVEEVIKPQGITLINFKPPVKNLTQFTLVYQDSYGEYVGIIRNGQRARMELVTEQDYRRFNNGKEV